MDYRQCGNEAVLAYHRGDHRLAATKYLQSFDGMPDKFDKNRWQIFHGYTSILQEEYFRADATDINSLKRIADNKHEAKLYRVEASFTCGLLLWLENQRDDAADYYREAIRMAQKAPSKERHKKVLASIPTPDGTALAGVGPRLVGEIIDETRHRAEGNLQQMEQSQFEVHNFAVDGMPTSSQQRLRSDGTPMPPAFRFTGIPVGPRGLSLTQEQINRMLTVGGDTCDGCHKTLQELGRKKLDKCTRCNKAYYCGKKCQVQQWKAGHKDHCRAPGVVQPGDFLRLTGIESKPEINGSLVEVLRADPNTNGRWEVQIPGGVKSISVASGKLEQLRPLK